MKKLNLENNSYNDDEQLISLLKTSVDQNPSEQFVNNTLKKMMVLNKKEKKVNKPLKFPLYLMLVIGLILFAPAIFSFDSVVTIPDSNFVLKYFIQNLSSQLDLLYTMLIMILLLTLMFFIWVELNLIKLRNPST